MYLDWLLVSDLVSACGTSSSDYFSINLRNLINSSNEKFPRDIDSR